MRYLTKVNLNYRELSEGANLYDDVDKSAEDIVPAQYAHWGIYDGNPDICALPKPYGFQTMCAIHTRPVEYRREAVAGMPLWQRRLELLKLKQLRYPALWHDDLENAVAMALLSSYSSRKLALNEFENELTKRQDVKTAVKSGVAGSTQGVSVIGPSGVGKSCGVELVVSKYPRAIWHEFPELGYSYVQIPLILVTAPANSNIAALYLSIASQIDDILSTGDMHLKKIRSLNLGKMAEIIKSYINRYHIGMILIDEAQLMNYENNKSSSFESMLTITASTGVSLGIVGTEETMEKWGDLLRLHRRFGTRIKADSYCSDKNYLRSVIKRMWKYQFVTHPIPLTEEIVDTLISESLGSMDMLSSMFMMLQYDIMSGNGPADGVVSARFVKAVSDRYFKQMKQLLQESIVENEINFKSIREELTQYVHDASRKEHELERRKQMALVMENRDKYDRDQCLYEVLSAVTNCYDYTEAAVKQAFAKAEREPGFGKLNIKGMTRAVIEILADRDKVQEKRQEKNIKTEKAAGVRKNTRTSPARENREKKTATEDLMKRLQPSL